MKKTPLLLAILDGLALNPSEEGNAVTKANTPILDKLLTSYPHTNLVTCGPRVGLPEGQMGNSEVGHLNIGAGRVVEQELTKIDRILSEASNDSIPTFINFVKNINSNNKTLHFIGLISNGGVHSSLNQILQLIRKAAIENVSTLSIHIITDGRDRPPREAEKELSFFVSEVNKIKSDFPSSNIILSSLIGRYFAMDRDKRWERTQLAYDLFVDKKGEHASDISSALKSSYSKDVTDEFIPATTLPGAITIGEGDGIMFCNFRADRMKQIVEVFENSSLNLRLLTLTKYNEDSKIPVLFPKEEIKNPLGEIVSKLGLSQLRIAETEKFAHVTYFFNGGEEKEFPGEDRILVQSPKDVATYDLKPEMSANEVTAKLLDRLESSPPDVTILNFANCDMVGHTGVFEAAVKAVETVDTCLGKLVDKYEELKGIVLVTADHGNADQMIDYQTKGPHTYHTLYPVPLVLLDFRDNHKTVNLRSGGALCDISPTILELLGVDKPKEMTGESLIVLGEH